jgi:hypothetical protein
MSRIRAAQGSEEVTNLGVELHEQVFNNGKRAICAVPSFSLAMPFALSN